MARQNICLSEADSVVILFGTRDEDLVPVRIQQQGEEQRIRRISSFAPSHDNNRWSKIEFPSGRLGSFGANLIEERGFGLAFVAYTLLKGEFCIEATFSRNGTRMRKRGYQFCELGHLFEATAEKVEVSMWSKQLSIVLRGLTKSDTAQTTLCSDEKGYLYKVGRSLST